MKEPHESDALAALTAELRALELQLHLPAVRSDAAALARLLHADFTEIGRSGRAYTRAEMVAHLLEPDDAQPPVTIVADAFVLSELAPGAALLNYRSAHRTADGGLQRHTLRSSLWLHTPQGWQLRFHQGTATADWA